MNIEDKELRVAFLYHLDFEYNISQIYTRNF